ncbi:hypothetical protein DFJ74DRAFT_704848 [Hyaloraphidium curvatum]|nr:hypothetical protein DFJ74DRAFT_704848 [Hyaloraphidium curvatum]
MAAAQDAPPAWLSQPLPAGWVSEFDANHQAWYFVDTTKKPPFVTWDDPREPPEAAAPAAPAAAPAAPAPAAPAQLVAPAAVPAGNTGVAPGEQPLPAGWLKALDKASGRYFFIDPKQAVTWDDPRTPEVEKAPSNPNKKPAPAPAPAAAPAPAPAAPAGPKPPPPPPRTDVIPLSVSAPSPSANPVAPPPPGEPKKKHGFWTGAAIGAGTALVIFNPISAVIVGGAAAVGYVSSKMGDSDDEKDKKK